MSKEIVLNLFDLLKTKGSDLQYGNENVTQLEHALQCAELAEKSNHSKEIITAALLHDIGHLLYDGNDPILKGIDGKHENLGADYLSRYFDHKITLPIRAHVNSKRYLAFAEAGYFNLLSEASKISLIAQGGPFTKEEAENFLNQPLMKEAIELRKFDDLAKELNKINLPIEYFQHYVEASLRQ